jgi:hypothetical protein
LGIGEAAIDGTPVLSSVGGLKYTSIRGSIDDVGVCGINGQGINILISQAVVDGAPVSSTIEALEYPIIRPCIECTGV